MNAWLSNTIISTKLTFRDRQALFWTYVFPLFSLFLFASIFSIITTTKWITCV